MNRISIALAVLVSFVLTGCEEPLPPSVTTGDIRVTSEPSGARVFLDDSDTGRITPYVILDVQAGSHTIRLTLDGHVAWGPEAVAVVAGQRVLVDATLEAVEPEPDPEPEPEPQPDLEVSIPAFSSGRFGEGIVIDNQGIIELVYGADNGFVSLRAVVQNVGEGDAPASTLRLYRSPDVIINAADMELWADTVSALAAGAEHKQTIVVRPPSPPVARVFYGLCVDQVPGEPASRPPPHWDFGSNCDVFLATFSGIQYWSSQKALIIADGTPSTFADLSYSGEQRISVSYSNRPSRSVYVYEARYTDDMTIAVMVDQQFPRTRADDLAALYAQMVGVLPDRSALHEFAVLECCGIHGGYASYHLNRIAVFHGDARLSIGVFGSFLLHEYAHLAYDRAAYPSARWRAAVAADPQFITTYARDFPHREDVAESFIAWFAVRCTGGDRFTPPELDFIRSAIPARLAYFDELLGGRSGCPSG